MIGGDGVHRDEETTELGGNDVPVPAAVAHRRVGDLVRREAP